MFLDILSVALLYSLVLLGITGVLSVVFLTFLQTIPPLIVLYSLWLVYDWRTAFQGGRAARYCFLSRWSLFKNIRDYFPIKFLATQHLDSTKNYIFGYHPHGMVPVGALVCFATKAAGLEQLYPGIKPRVSMVSCEYTKTSCFYYKKCCEVI